MSTTSALGRSLDWLSASFDAFERTLRIRPPARIWMLAIGIATVSVLLFGSLAPQGFNLGDGPIYADRIAERAFGEVTKHLGYFYLGVAATAVLPGQPDHALNLMNALLGGLAAGLVALIAYTLTGRWVASLAASATFVATLLFAQEAVYAEVYMPQLFFWLLSVQLALWNVPVGSGLAFSAAFLVTPSTILTAPFVVLLRPKTRFVLVWAAAAAIPALAALAPHMRNFLWGDSGVLSMPPGDLARIRAISKDAKEIAKFSGLLAFVATGLYVIVRSPRHRLFSLALLCLWLFPFLLGERYSDVPVQLPLYSMLAVLAGVGLARLVAAWPRERIVPAVATMAFVACLGLVASSTYRYLSRSVAEIDAYRDAVLRMAADMEAGDVVLAPYPVLRLSRHYAGEDSAKAWISYDALSTDSAAGRKNAQTLEGSLESGRRIWLPDPRPPDGSVRSLLDAAGYRTVPYASFWLATRESAP